jgi:hypothetical protein
MVEGYVYPILCTGAVLAPAMWASNRYDLPIFKQAEIALLIGVTLLWMGATIGLFGELPFRPLTLGDNISAVVNGPPDSRKSAAAWFFQPVAPRASLDGKISDGVGRIAPNPLPGLDGSTAIYDISAHAVYLPDGTTLEAHSGLGSRIDDPRYVRERMRGATPPNLYELTLREKPFHGVQALRLVPIGDGAGYGRAGFLAHTYMLGPNGDSNGCVVFKNYQAFLQAFQNGGVKRLFVVDHIDKALVLLAREGR